MPKTKPPYGVEFRHQMVELVQAGRTLADLSRVLDCTAKTMISRVARSTVHNGKPLPARTCSRA